ncbi:MAG: sulfatase-like hydrolase/transferase [Pirellulaceae bacterium]|nr:sulfatase-like hydrolase/transferase [Pirellulaceae bacterium]
MSRPNIVLILADDLGVNDLACYGRADHRTPKLDALAKAGARFTTAYTAQPICSPSRAALMTGKCPARLHLTNYLPGRPDAPSQKLIQPVIEGQLPLEEPTLAEWLRGAGYTTGLFGKWHLGNKGFGAAEQGFDVVVSPPANTKPSAEEGGKGEYAITAAAEKFITENRDKPFFCYVPHNNPHIPLGAKPELTAKNSAAFHPTYAAMIETLDDAVGRLISKVDELGLTERTIFIFTSDNGGLHVLESPGTPATHNTPYRAGKGYVYEGGLREPLIVRWPGVIQPGKTIDTPVVLTDLVSTLLEAAGLNLSKTVGPLDGVSLMPLLRGEKFAQRSLFWHFPNYTNQGGRPAGAIRSGNFKLIEHFEDDSVELYDLAADPSEKQDLSKQDRERADKLRQELAAWRKRVGAQMPTPNPGFKADMHQTIYGQQDSSKLVPEKTAAATEPGWKDWRKAMSQATAGNKPKVTPASGDIRLHAKDAIVHAEKMRYEPESHKNVLGFWTNPKDWAEWKFDVAKAGKYEIEVQQGCGTGAGGSEVNVEVAGQTLKFTVVETGHFQHMILRTIGVVDLPSGSHALAIKPQTKPGVAVMDVRRVVLRPVP